MYKWQSPKGGFIEICNIDFPHKIFNFQIIIIDCKLSYKVKDLHNNLTMKK